MENPGRGAVMPCLALLRINTDAWPMRTTVMIDDDFT
jgi:hypothetical protein